MAGPFDFDGYDPTDPSEQQEPYKRPAADQLSSFGILTDQQRAQMAMQQQNSLRMQQLAQQQKMLQLQQTQQNMSVGAAQLGTGFGFPVLQAMGGGNPQNTQLTSALNKIIQSRQAKSAGINADMASMGGGPSGDNDASKILNEEIQNNPDTGSAYIKASARIAALGNKRGDSHLLDIATRMRLAGNQQQLSAGKITAETAKDNAQATNDTTTSELARAKAGNPGEAFGVNFENGDVGKMVQLKNQDGSFKSYQVINRGKQAQYTVAELPGDRSKDLRDYREYVGNIVQSSKSMDQIVQNMKQGGSIGWTGEAVEAVNNVVGSLKQLAPTANVTQDAVKEVNKYSSDFDAWAKKTNINSSIMSDLTMQLAASYAKGGRISNVEIKHAHDTLGESIGDPSTLAAVLGSVKSRLLEGLSTKRDTLKIGSPKDLNDQVDQLYDYAKTHITTADTTAVDPKGRKSLDSFYK